MSDLAARVAGLSPAQRKLLEQRLKTQQSTPKVSGSVAIIGMACRFPGAASLQEFWRLISEGRSAAAEVPADRWSVDAFFDASGETPGKTSIRWGAFIENPDQFDPQFFGITPREAVRMDPQQRLLLEVAWEAMENAGRPAEELAGTRTGVFVGIGSNDYSKTLVGQDHYYQNIDAHMGTGNALSIAANRVSYVFDLHGPSAAVDTACSSSSLSVHFAVESLRRGESDAALAGGANLILTPETTIAFSKARMLSPEGVCRPFDARANGYVRGEGCAFILLKRLEDAERDGDNILAVIRATSVNQDGRTSGISAPNSQSQVACIRAALKQADLSPNDIDYIEAHGTGTPLGDPIEMMALSQIFTATDKATSPCYVTSVKANVGHMETVSGVAGLIKTVLMMQHDEILSQANFESLNPHIKLDGTRLAIPTKPIAWQRSKRRRIAGISSFGFGGTNTHLIVEAATPRLATVEHNGGPSTHTERSDRPLHVVKLSAKSENALKQQAGQLTEYLEQESNANLADVCWSANTAWSDFNHRAVVSAANVQELQQRLKAFSNGDTAAGVKQATVRSIGRPNVAFLFTGQGSQYVDMGRKLFESHPVFRRALEKCDEILRQLWSGHSLLGILYPSSSLPDSEKELIHQTQFTQPALFALEYALAKLWESWGVQPDIVLGHSVGEYAAACIAGVMSLEDGLRLIAERARLMQGVKQHGKMAVIFASPDRVRAQIATVGANVVIAVLNGPENVVISGAADAVDRLVAAFESEGVQVHPLNVSHAFHSPLMDEMLNEFEAIASEIEFRTPRVPLAANLTGQLMTEAPTAQYWRDHLRNAVQFAGGMARIAEAKPAIIIEIGPSASLLGMGRRCEPKLEAAWLPSLREKQDDWQVIAASLSDYYLRGGKVDWRGWDKPWQRRRLLLPNYPFQRSRHWFDIDLSKRVPTPAERVYATASNNGRQTHPLLGVRLATVWANQLFESRLSKHSPAYLVDHQVQGSVVTPAAAYIEQGLAATEELFGPGQHGLANLSIQQAMFLPDGSRRRVQVSASPESGGESTFEVHSRNDEESDPSAAWNMHATGTLEHESKSSTDEKLSNVDLAAARQNAVQVRSREEFYQAMAERGLAYGPAFQMLGDLHRGIDTAVASVVLPESIAREAAAYQLHPVLGDAMLQAMAGAVPLENDGSFSPFTYMPVAIRRVRVIQRITDFKQPLFVYARRTSSDSNPSPERVEADLFLVSDAGEVLIAFEGAQVQRLGRSGAVASTVDTSRWLYDVVWRELPSEASDTSSNGHATSAPARHWILFADAAGVAQEVADRLAGYGGSCILIHPGVEFVAPRLEAAKGAASRHAIAKIDPLDETHYRKLLDGILANGDCAGIVHLWSLDVPGIDPAVDLSATGTSTRNPAMDLGCSGALQLVRALARTSFKKQPSLWMITAGAQAVSADGIQPLPIAVEQSPMIGFTRVAAIELPDFRPTLIDLERLEGTYLGDSAGLLSHQILNPINESEIAFRNSKRFVPRLVHRTLAQATSGEATSSHLTIPRGPFQLRITQSGSFDALKFVPVDRAAPAAGQVEIEVHATGLNFSDVLKALGLYPGIKDAIVPLGIEASGVVTAVGEGVDRFHIGDEVLGVVPYAFASHARTADYALVHKPKSIDHDAACTIPITFLTAYYGLVRLAQMQPGERVLIHAGAGGVGLAAIQIAQQVGAEIFATAGSESKRAFLRSLGVKHIYSSRSTAFADEILADTNREGVDIVLNSLPGEAISKSLSILRAYGRFLEIGKTDIYQNRMLGLLPFQDNLSYFAIDLDRMLRQRPDYIRQLFAEVMRHFGTGDYQPLMFTRFEGASTIDSFRYMSQRKNIGKVVVSIPHAEINDHTSPNQPAIQNSPPESKGVRKVGTYLITGGLGALGMGVANWLADQGAGTIALISRRGPSAESEAALRKIRDKGAEVVSLRGDVANADSLCAALASLPSDAPPLRGVIHAAGVLADGILTEMTLEQLDRAMSPKIQGALNLHTATRDYPLDFFVLFSSIASILGSPGQANYAAGNAYLDALAHERRREGLPATSINWGPWAGSGMAAEAGRDESVKSRGLLMIEPEDGLDLLGKLLKTDDPQTTVVNANWSDLFKLLGSRRPALLAEIGAELMDSSELATDRVDHAFRKKLLSADAATRQSLVQEYIRQELARIMGIEPATLETNQPLSTFGLDSLLALELKNNLEGRLDFVLPMAKLMEGPSIESLATETALILSADSSEAAEQPADSDRKSPPTWTPLIPLRESGSNPPLILLPALGGDSRYYVDLVQQLGKDQPVYVFRPRGLDQDLPPHLTITEMVADYISALRTIQPTGPYYLAGWSTGGTFAFAMAEGLERLGEEVALLALMDSPLPSLCDDVNTEDDARFFCDLINFANRGAGANVRLDYEKLTQLPQSEQLTAAVKNARHSGMLPAETPEEYVRSLVAVGQANVCVLQSYRPQPLSITAQFFTPESREALAELSGRTPPNDVDLGWSRQIGQSVEIHRLSGDHFTMMFGQSASALAQELHGFLTPQKTATATSQSPR